VHLLKGMLVAAVSVLLGGCLSSPAPAGRSGKDTATGGLRPEQSVHSPAPDGGELAARLSEFLENGLEKIDQGVISEGISQLVAVLAEAEEAGRVSGDAREIVSAAETELTKVAAALEMEAGTEWLDANKNQISASAIDAGTENSLDPSVILTYNFGTGKALVTGAPITFQFVQGSGLLTGLVATNDYGQANCAIARLDNPNRETIVRASLIYRARGYVYPFGGTIRDFVYVPPARRATILVMEKAGQRIQDDPVILDAVYNRLKQISFDFSQYNGMLLGEQFSRAFGGDPNAIRTMGLEKEVSYLVMLLSDGYYVNQVELDGKKYNIFRSRTRATTRIIRVSDGKVLYSATVQAVAGQGGSEDRAVLDGFRNAAQAMAEKLEADFPEIEKVLAGTE
jgi:hypothetical protein